MATGLKTRICLAALGLVGAFTFLSTHLVTLQVVEHEKWQNRAEADYARRHVLPAHRGMIFDRQGEQLVHNLPVFDLVADRHRLEDHNTVVHGLATAQGLSHRQLVISERREGREGVKALLPGYYDYVAKVLADHIPGGWEEIRKAFDFGLRQRAVLAKEFTPAMREEIVAALRESGVRGIDFEERSRRFYPSDTMACHILGFVDHGAVGREGVEATMNEWLAGEPGYRETMVDRHGREIPAYRGRVQAPRNGANVHLSIDSALQTVVEEEIAAGMEEFGVQRISAVLLDPSSGDILAMANRPLFDPNDREGDRCNFGFSSVVEPGSTFKVVAVSAALDLGLVSPETRVFCHNGELIEGKLRVPDHARYGWLTVSDIVARSSNIGAFKLARQVGMSRFYGYVDRFGFGQRTGVRLTAENPGIIRRSHNKIDFSRCSYGYAVSVTPLQLASAYSALANEGVRMKLRLVTKVTDREGHLLWENPTEIRTRVMKPSTASQMARAMRGVLEKERCTGKLAKVPGYRVAGKTGTSTRYDPRQGGYVEGTYVCSFAGFLPAESPRLVCVVVADNPSTDTVHHYGGTIAGPVFSRINSRAMALLDVPPTNPEEILRTAAVE